MEIVATAIPEVLRLTLRRWRDTRGAFVETWNARACAAAGVTAAFVQDNLSWSTQTGAVRGLHYRAPPHAQGKLARVARGRIRDVAVDARRGSPSYGRWVAETLSAQNGARLWILRGFLHGFVTLEPDTEVACKVDAFYDRDSDGAVRFDDPDLAIDWGIDPAAAVLSDKDSAAGAWADFVSPFVHGAEP
ncbi:dTDP-4-dehydrorhamnose 3,5-epimerase [bacterium CG17_big_fil_post_rev_8_21_14_2_50_64_8]|nr:MAG: dTDP-4-dehydrorhamnose 3,5-epimerase [bacterium CG17_big_fil_post_rev_8_21_14_2_50_64_8]PIY72898.1 MAG: dTDP-4-dehydrorhamnose 3,5-epimerase [Rhodobacterales bacterium CG_4_10_14_0_8_um_filter_70_9]